MNIGMNIVQYYSSSYFYLEMFSQDNLFSFDGLLILRSFEIISDS